MIGICVKYYNENYGGMLQTYATTKFFEKAGYQYELIRYQKKINFIEILRNIPRIFNGVWQHEKYELVQKKIVKKFHPNFKKNDNKRLEAFKRFREKNFINLSPVYIGMKNLKEAANNYEIIVSGSDQLWSPSGLPTNFYNLMFVPQKVKKVTIASSFGVKNIPWYQKQRTIKFLKRIEYISMREMRGSEIVRELTGRNVPTILDPVLWFDREEWLDLIEFKEMCSESYIFVYFLGNNKKYRDSVRRAARYLKCKIITIRHADQYVDTDEKFGDIAPYNVDPADFLNYIRGARFVFTDSFHASLFSVIYHKPFIVFDRFLNTAKYSKNTRIDSMCKLFNLENYRYRNEEMLFEQINLKYNFENVDKKIEYYKKETMKYLTNALEGNK